MRKILGILIFIVFIACSNSKSEELKENRNTNEQIAQVHTISKQDKSCTELEKYNINAEKIDLRNKGLEELNCVVNYKNAKIIDLRWNRIKDIKPLENLKK